MSEREAVSLSVGDRTSPLEVDTEADPIREHPLVGKTVGISPVAGGDLLGLRGKDAEVTGVLLNFGQVVGYELAREGVIHFATLKDVLPERGVLEDIQPATATSVAVRQALSHWRDPHTYWHTRIDGLESFCFALASVTPTAGIRTHQNALEFVIPEPLGDQTVVRCDAVLTGNFWSFMVSVYTERPESAYPATRIPDHWARTFSWTLQAAQFWAAQGFPWQSEIKRLIARMKATATVLRPMVAQIMKKVLETREELGIEDPAGGSRIVVQPGFSSVRLKPTTIGLTEPPSERRPYTIVSISPEVVRTKGYMQQVVLHECIHIGVASTGGKPHNDAFVAMSKKLGLKEEFRD